MPSRIRIFVLDDHAVVREAIRLICDAEPDLDYAGGSADVEDALRTIAADDPDVVLVDLHLPRASGIELIRKLGDTSSRARTVVLTVDREDELVSQALREGAVGILTKDLDPEVMVDAVRRWVDGGSGAAADRPPEAGGLASPPLSSRQKEVLRLVADGRSNREIAETLSVSERTVASHLSSIYRKLGVANRVLATRHALRMGLGPSSETSSGD